jgi:hypothetical protein
MSWGRARVGSRPWSSGYAALAVALLLAASAWAQTKGTAKPSRAPAVKTAPAKPKAPAKAPVKPEPSSKDNPVPDIAAPAAGRGEAKTTAASAVESDAGVKVVERGDGGAKQFRFSETDVEGRLKAPQLVYFLRRVRAEFAAGDLGHRSFMRELSETQREDSF